MTTDKRRDASVATLYRAQQPNPFNAFLIWDVVYAIMLNQVVDTGEVGIFQVITQALPLQDVEVFDSVRMPDSVQKTETDM